MALLLICWRYWKTSAGHIFVSYLACWLRKLRFEGLIRERQKLLAGLQNVDLFTMRTLKRPSCCCTHSDWWGRYEVPLFLFVTTALIILYFCELAFLGHANDQTGVWMLALFEHVLMVGAIFVINARNGACPSHYIYNPRFNLIGGNLSSRLPSKILDILKYLGL